MLPEEIHSIEEKEPTISKECYHIYSTTNKTLKEIATLKNIKYNTIKHYSKTYKYSKRMEYHNITKPRKPRSNTKPTNTPKKKAVKKNNSKKKKQAKKYTVYTYEHTTKIILILTDNELRNLKSRSKKECFLNVEDYLISTLKVGYEYIEANQLLGYDKRYSKLNKAEDIIIHHELTNPKLLTCNSIQDTKQTVLEDYI